METSRSETRLAEFLLGCDYKRTIKNARLEETVSNTDSSPGVFPFTSELLLERQIRYDLALKGEFRFETENSPFSFSIIFPSLPRVLTLHENEN